MIRFIKTGIPVCAILVWQAFAAANPAAGTKQDGSGGTPSAAIAPGDSVEHVLKVMGEPRVDCPLKGGKRVLIYEAGEIHLLNGKVTSCTILTEEQLAEKRERERKKMERAAAEKKVDTTRKKSAAPVSIQKEALLKKAEVDLKQKITYGEKVATRRMTNVVELYNLMVLKGGKSRLRYERDLLENMPNNTLEEFYNIDINFEYFERIYSHNPSATLTLNSLYKEHALFIREYEKLREYEKTLAKVQKELKIIAAKNRSQR